MNKKERKKKLREYDEEEEEGNEVKSEDSCELKPVSCFIFICLAQCHANAKHFPQQEHNFDSLNETVFLRMKPIERDFEVKTEKEKAVAILKRYDTKLIRRCNKKKEN